MTDDDDGTDDRVVNPGLRGPRRDEDFDTSYRTGTPPPWDIGRPQAAFVRLLEAGEVRGHVLDVGCGTGEHALMAAAAGFVATGVDAAPTAIRLAREKAAQRTLQASFEVGDALDLSSLGTTFDTVLDCGLFHVFDDDDRARFEASLAGVVVPGGRYFMLCFSDRQPGDRGPRRVTEDELRSSFTDRWQVDAIEATVLELTINPDGAQAWLASFTRT